MHHHLQYISNCIAGGDTEKAQQYIRSISEQIGSAAVRRYCSCEALDLLLSAYIDRAESLGIRCDVAVQAATSLRDFPRQDSGKDRLCPCSGRERPRPADDQCIPAR